MRLRLTAGAIRSACRCRCRCRTQMSVRNCFIRGSVVRYVLVSCCGCLALLWACACRLHTRC